MSEFYNWLGPDGDSDEESAPPVEYNPFEALANAGISPPEPIEAPTPVEEPVGEVDSNKWEEAVTEARNIVAGGCMQEGDLVCFPPFLPQSAPPLAGINPKDAIGATKPDLSLIPPAALLYEAQAMMDGARKYGPFNWRENPVLMRVYISAAMRHLQQMLDGENIDPISGVYHIGHARACLGILADAQETGNLKDDRPLPGPAGRLIRNFTDYQTYVSPEPQDAA